MVNLPPSNSRATGTPRLVTFHGSRPGNAAGWYETRITGPQARQIPCHKPPLTAPDPTAGHPTLTCCIPSTRLP